MINSISNNRIYSSTRNNTQINSQKNVFATSIKKDSVSFQGAGSSVKKAAKGSYLYKQYDKFTSFLAKQFSKVIDKKPMESLVKATNIKKQMSYLLTFNSLIISGFYIKNTLQSDKLDSQKKLTLAINQGAVAILSGILAFGVNGKIDSLAKRFISKFEKVNAGSHKLPSHVRGIGIAKDVAVFGLIYRFISPVFVTPIANKLGNKIQEYNNKQSDQKTEPKLALGA